MKNYEQLSDAEKWDLTAEDYDQLSENATGQYLLDVINISGLLEQYSKEVILRVIDIAGGNGLLARKILQSLKDSNRDKNNFYICSTDFSEKMVQVAKQRMSQLQIRDDLKQCCDFQVMDGQNLTVDSNSLDFAFSCFGLFMFPNRKKGLEEMYRVLKPSGKGIISSWATFHFEVSASVFQKVVNHPEIQPIKQLLKQPNFSVGFKEENSIKEELAAVGFKNIKIVVVQHNFVFPSGKQFAKIGRAHV